MDLIITKFSTMYLEADVPWSLCISCLKGGNCARYHIVDGTLKYENCIKYKDQYYLIEGSIIMDRSIRNESGEKYASKAIKTCDKFIYGPNAGATSIDYDGLVSMYSQLLNATIKPLTTQQYLSFRECSEDDVVPL